MKNNLKNILLKKISMILLIVITGLTIMNGANAADSAPENYFIVNLKDPVFNGSTFKYSNAEITANDDSKLITSMTVSVDKGYIDSSGTAWTNGDIKTNHQTVTWLFDSGKSTNEVQGILRNVSFMYVEGMNVNVTVDGNSNNIPSGAAITEFTPADSTDGKPHYYLYVAYTITPNQNETTTNWDLAYNDAKSRTFMGMRGYLVTITSEEEDEILNNISSQGAWAGGARIYNGISNSQLDPINAELFSNTDNITTDQNRFYETGWKWVCGPEAGTGINIEGSTCARNGLTNLNPSGYQNWRRKADDPNGADQEPNNYNNAERWMQVHFYEEGGWNDLSQETKGNTNFLSGYFIEFSDYGGDNNSSTKTSNYVSLAKTTVTDTLVHKHHYAYTSTGSSINVKCDKDLLANETNCPNHGNTVLTRTISAPSTSKTYDGLPFSGVTITGNEFSTIDEKATDAGIKYVGIDGTSYGPSTTAPTNAGKYKAYFSVTSDDGTCEASINITINKKSLDVTPNIQNIHYDDTVSNNPSNVSETGLIETDKISNVVFNVDTSYHTTNNDTKRDVSITSIVIKDNNDNDVTSNYEINKNTQEITLQKILATVVTNPTATDITYGQTLGDSTVTGQMSCEGTFSFEDTSVIPHVKASDSLDEFNVVFTPTYPDKYELPDDTLKASITVHPKELELKWSNTSLVYNGSAQIPTATLETDLVGTDSNPISVSGEKIDVGTYTATAVCNSSDYTIKSSNKEQEFTISQTDLIVEPKAQTVNYGQSISSTTSDITVTGLVGTDAIASVTLTADTTTASPNDKAQISVSNVTIKNGDTDVKGNYNIIYGTNIVNLIKNTPSFGTPTASAITYGDAISSSTITGGITTVPGHFEWVDNTTKPNASGTTDESFNAKFIPDDSSYDTVDVTIPVHVNKKQLTVEWSDLEHTYDGQTHKPTVTITDGIVGSDVVNTTVTGEGKLVGDYPCEVTISNNNYFISDEDSEETLTVKVRDITVAANDQTIDYKQPASSTTSDVTIKNGTLAGEDSIFEVSISANEATNSVDINSIVIHNGNDDVTNQYNITKLPGKLTYNKISPELISNPTTTPITYGDSLTEDVITGGSFDVPGTFTWKTSEKPHVSDSDTTEYIIVFTPDDTEHYTNVEIPVKVTVNPKELELEWSNTSLVYNGSAQVPTATLKTELVGTDSNPISVSGDETYVGNYTATATSNSADYTIKSSTKDQAFTIGKADLLVKPTVQNVNYGQSISSTTNDISVTGLVGTDAVTGVTLTADTTTVVADNKAEISVSNITIKNGNTDVKDNYNITYETNIVNLGKNIPSYGTPSASAITYGDAISSSTITGGITTVPGHFEWTDDTIKPNASGTSDEYFDAKFIPDDSSYDTVDVTIPVHVNKKQLTVEWSDLEHTYDGQTHKPTVTITDGIVGSDVVNTTVTGEGKLVGDYPCEVTISNNNYFISDEDSEETLTVKVRDITVAANDQTIDYKQPASSTASDVTIKNGTLAGEDSIFEVSISANEATNSVDINSIVIHNGNDDVTNQYNITKLPGKLTYNKISPELISNPTTTPITYGDSLTEDIITGGSFDVPGTFTWKTSEKPHVSDSDTTEYIIVFTPDDTEHYTNVEIPVTVTVNPKELEIGWANTSLVYNGNEQGPTATLKTQLVGDDSNPISISGYKTNVGNYTATATSNSADYTIKSSTKDQAYTISKTDLVVEPKSQTVNYGESISSTTSDITVTGLVGTDAVTGVTLTADTTTVVADNKAEISVSNITIKNGNNDVKDNYNITYKTNTVNLGKNIPPFTTPSTTAITYGDEISSTTFVGGITTVPGHFEWVDGTIKPNASGDSDEYFEAKFVPDDSSYDTVNVSIPVHVNKKQLTVEWSNLDYTYDGQTHNPTVTITDGIIGNDVVDTNVTGEGKLVGEYPCEVTTTNNNYFISDEDSEETLKVKARDITVSANDQTVDYKQTISSTTSDVTIKNGTLAGEDSIFEVGISANEGVDGTNSLNIDSIVIHNGNDDVTNQYNITKLPGKLTYNKISPQLIETPTTTPITYGDSLTEDIITGGSFDVPGTFTWKTSEKPHVSDSDITEYIIVFTPNDTKHYTNVEIPVKVTVNPKTLEIEWSNTNFNYDGEEHKPNANIKSGIVGTDTIDLVVKGEKIDALDTPYIATCEISNNDYIIKDGTSSHEFTINKVDISDENLVQHDFSFDKDDNLTIDLMGSKKELIEGNDYLTELVSDGKTITITVTGVNNYFGTIKETVDNPAWVSDTGEFISIDEGTKRLEPKVTETPISTIFDITENSIKLEINNTSDQEQIDKLNKALLILNDARTKETSANGSISSKLILVLTDIKKLAPIDETLVYNELNAHNITNAKIISTTDIQLKSQYFVYNEIGSLILKKEESISDISANALGDNAFDVEIELTIPDEYYKNDGSRTFYLVREHNENGNIIADMLPIEQNEQTIKIRTNKFSTYTLLYKDKEVKPKNDDGGNIESPQTGDSVMQYIVLETIALITFIMCSAKLKKYRHNK